MRPEPPARPDLTGEVRFKIPLVFAIPLAAFALIGVVAIGFGTILLSVPTKAATTIAIVTAANILGACAFLYLRPRVGRSSVMELMIVALYPIIVGIAIAQIGLGETTSTAGEAPSAPTSTPAAEGLIASGTQWQTDALALEAGKPKTITVENQDAVVHNMSIYPDEEAATAHENPLFKGEEVQPGDAADYEIDPLKKGTYTFVCDFHANMKGEVTVE